MKYISFVIPSYNSEAYLKNAVKSILVGGETVEIIIVNDGSTDKTSKIAHKLAEKHPTIVKAIDKKNGGHGSAVNTGLAHATGRYFKVVDSDDWVNGESLQLILSKIDEFEKSDEEVDMLISNYVYEKVDSNKQKVISYKGVLPEGEIFTWEETNRFQLGQYILMHSVIYRTDLLKFCQLELPEHTFYVDNIYVYYPLPYIKDMYYIDTDFYRYYIGREDQSVNEKNMIARVDQQIRVTKTMIDMYYLKEIMPKKLRYYMLNYLAIMMTVSSIILIRSKNPENYKKKDELWDYLRKKDLKAFLKIRYGILGHTTNLPGRSGRKISSLVYIITRRIIGFN